MANIFPLIFELVPEEGEALPAGRSVRPGHAENPELREQDGRLPERLVYLAGQTLAQAVYLSGRFLPPPLCSGLAHCGRCRVRLVPARGIPLASPVTADVRVFSPAELTDGWRLGCRHHPLPGLRVELPAEARFFDAALKEQREAAARLTRRRQAEPRARPPSAQPSQLAVDLGTTSLQWRQQVAGAAASEPPLWQGSLLNPQMGAGSDVISRLAIARSGRGKARLRSLTVNALAGLVENARSMTPSGEVTELCLAANTAMTYITLGLDTTPLAVAPYSLPYAGGGWEHLPGLPQVWVPPQLSPFVGGDVSAGYAALALDPEVSAPAYPFLLADMGTNGEFLLALGPDSALAASVALGPALEGIGLSRGTEARPYAVADFMLTPQGVSPLFLADNALVREPVLPGHLPGHPADVRRTMPSLLSENELPPGVLPSHIRPVAALPGITGTGYLALLHLLLTLGIMDRDGRFTLERNSRFKRLAALEVGGQPELVLPFGLRLTANDVEEALKVKAAFSLGLRRLLDAAGLASRDLAGIHIAGALGRHVRKEALEELGFVPQGMGRRMEVVGNTALAGASLLLRAPKTRPALVRWAERVKTVDLASDKTFMQKFAENMRFVW